MGRHLGAIPAPVSAISTTTQPGASGSSAAETVSVPLPAMASIALSTRLVHTWLSSPAIASIGASPSS